MNIQIINKSVDPNKMQIICNLIAKYPNQVMKVWQLYRLDRPQGDVGLISTVVLMKEPNTIAQYVAFIGHDMSCIDQHEIGWQCQNMLMNMLLNAGILSSIPNINRYEAIPIDKEWSDYMEKQYKYLDQYDSLQQLGIWEEIVRYLLIDYSENILQFTPWIDIETADEWSDWYLANIGELPAWFMPH